MAENTARASGVFASSSTRQPGNDGESSTDDGGVTPTHDIDSDDESTMYPGQLRATVMNETSTETETDIGHGASLSAPSMPRVTKQDPDTSSSSEEISCHERGARGQGFTDHQLTESQAKILKLKQVQRKVLGDLKTSSTCFKFDRNDKTRFFVKPAFKARLDKILNQNIRTEEFHVRNGDESERGVVASFNTEELQHEMLMDYDGEKLTLVYHVTTESKISESLNRLRTPQREIRLPFAVGRFLEVRDNFKKFIKTFHYNLRFQVCMGFHKDHTNHPFLRVTCNRNDKQAAYQRVEEYIASVEQRDLKISLATGLYLQSLPGQRELQAIAKRHHCVTMVESPAQRVLLRASHRNDVLLVCEGNFACCIPQVFILPLHEGQTEWPLLYRRIMEIELLSSNAGEYARRLGPPPKPWVLTTTSTCGDNKKTVIVMFVPKLTNEDDFKRKLQESCMTAMQSAIGVFHEAEIVLPITLGGAVPLKYCALPLLMAVRETVRDNAESAVYVKFFIEKPHQHVGETVSQMENRLFGCGWSLDKHLENPNSEKATPASSRDRGDVDSATVRLVALKQDVAKATDEVSTIDIPPEYEVRAEEFKTTYSQTVLGSSLKTKQRRTIPKSETSTSAPPVQHGLQEADTEVGSNQQGSENRGSSQTSLPPSAAKDTPLPQSQARAGTNEMCIRELDATIVEALKILMQEDFSRVQVDHTTRNQVTLRCSIDTMSKIDSLRQEGVELGPEDMQKISAPMDTSEEGVAAYMVPVPQQGKVIIFSFDYNAISKAKHLLNVKLGKVKVTARARRRFEGKNDSGGDEASSHSLPSSLAHKSSTDAEFNTRSGIKVSVYNTDITKLPVDAIVNAANESLAHGGGVAYAISRAAGFELEDEGQEYMRRHGPLKVREVMATTAGSLPCKKVLHAVGPRWADYKDKARCRRHLADTVYNCLIKADTMRLTSLAIPPISAGLFGVPKEVCAVSYLFAVQSFDKDCGRDTSLRHVHFVDVNDDMINTVQETFKQHWNTDMSLKKQ